MTLIIATPIRAAELWAAQVTLGYAESVRALSLEMPIKTVVTYALDVVRARNRVVGIVLREKEFADVTNVLWWDDDQWPEDRSIVQRMLALDLPVVGAAYTNKKKPVRFVHQQWESKLTLDSRGVGNVRAVGFGFTMTSRACLEEMAEEAHWYRDFPNATTCPDLFGQLYDRPSPGDTEETLLSEDFSFCKRWREQCSGLVRIYGGGVIAHAGAHAWSAREIVHDLSPGHERAGG
jgi:hypothetical protein